MIKRTNILGYTLGLALMGLGLSGLAQAQTLKFSSATLNDVQHQYQVMFKQKVDEKLPQLSVELYPASQLGPIPRMVEGVMFGTIESFITATAFLSQVDPRFQTFDVATIFRNPDITRQLLASDSFRARSSDYGSSRNIQPLSTFVHSPNSIISKKPINSLKDLAGLKVRVLGTPFQIEPMKALGATPVPMPLSEVMPALQTGAIDAVIAAPTVASAFRYYDAAPYMTMVESWPLIVTVIASRNWFNGLPDGDRQALQQVAKDVEADAVQWGLNDVMSAAATWTANGGTLTYLEPEVESALQEVIATSTAPLVKKNPALAGEVEALSALAEQL